MPAPLQKNQVILLSIQGYTAQGEGVGRHEGMAVFVPLTIAGEQVRALIIKVSKTFAIGKLLEVVSPSEHRVDPPCPHYARCGGCSLMHMDGDEQRHAKQQRIMDCMARLAHLPLEQAPALHTMDHPLHYRNKGAFPIAPLPQGGTAIGLYAKGSHRLVPLCDCLLQTEEATTLLHVVQDWMHEFALPAYDERTHQGLLRHVVFRQSTGGEWLVCLVASEMPSHLDALCARLAAALPKLIGVVVNLNKRPDNVILSDNEVLVLGQPRLCETLMGLQFEVSIRSFLQVNPLQTEVLYTRALQFAGLREGDVVVDAYCGVGTMSLLFAQHAQRVIGIECVPAAIEDATRNAALNGLADRTQFLCDVAEHALPTLLARGEQVDVLLLDPPRKGCEPALIEAAITAQIPRIVYVSCDPATLARDIALFAAGGYALRQLEGVDMFPQTAHVETVVLMSRKDK